MRASDCLTAGIVAALTLYTAAPEELDAASIRVIEGKVDLHFDGEVDGSEFRPWERRATFDVMFPETQARTLRYPTQHEDETFARISYDLREDSGDVLLDVLSHVQKGFFVNFDEEEGGLVDFIPYLSFSLTFETEETLAYDFEVDAPDLTRFTSLRAAFDGHEARAANNSDHVGGFGFPERFVDRGVNSYFEVAGPMVTSGTLPPGIHTLTLSMRGADNETFEGSGGAHLVLSPEGTIIPTPAAAGAGVLLLGLRLVRRPTRLV